jgi:hypothetical protein
MSQTGSPISTKWVLEAVTHSGHLKPVNQRKNIASSKLLRTGELWNTLSAVWNSLHNARKVSCLATTLKHKDTIPPAYSNGSEVRTCLVPSFKSPPSSCRNRCFLLSLLGQLWCCVVSTTWHLLSSSEGDITYCKDTCSRRQGLYLGPKIDYSEADIFRYPWRGFACYFQYLQADSITANLN